MSIKVISLGLQSPHSTLNIIQRGGKKIVLALCITIDTSADKIADVMPNTSVNFSIEEVPFSAVKKAFSGTDLDSDVGALIAMEDGKALSDEAMSVVRDFVRRSLMALPVKDYKRHMSGG
ncbi:hypothetical protein [Sinorhizobium fredii]|uniref:hypothetical protein n=1 Tax=Rhizobium fredii TaxID=380 RepID=UPI0004B785E8|nr:hypothetical protein [Sinorhizobium fredii]AWI60330.1 hypothetical protein AB395_00005153 [Sinorhizobium fredii CCBAU 45436]